ncbi:hypothetical protein BD310DRAFT_705128 [Dichomitus squalens]|uniref:Uncharacterized protein n=1 Tax=Dichomitus squalens TaxID=114155 RepID=A0A4Q9Q683_9APHY|nr:hypothetical protein BD310DRAFT_705128 [Dichomitus squalens]
MAPSPLLMSRSVSPEETGSRRSPRSRDRSPSPSLVSRVTRRRYSQAIPVQGWPTESIAYSRRGREASHVRRRRRRVLLAITPTESVSESSRESIHPIPSAQISQTERSEHQTVTVVPVGSRRPSPSPRPMRVLRSRSSPVLRLRSSSSRDRLPLRPGSPPSSDPRAVGQARGRSPQRVPSPMNATRSPSSRRTSPPWESREPSITPPEPIWRTPCTPPPADHTSRSPGHPSVGISGRPVTSPLLCVSPRPSPSTSPSSVRVSRSPPRSQSRPRSLSSRRSSPVRKSRYTPSPSRRESAPVYDDMVDRQESLHSSPSTHDSHADQPIRHLSAVIMTPSSARRRSRPPLLLIHRHASRSLSPGSVRVHYHHRPR